MSEIVIGGNISYIEAVADPLSADIGIVREKDAVWLYDVGNGDEPISELNATYNVVLSHFHPDHTGNITKLRIDNLYLSSETLRHLPEDLPNVSEIHVVRKPVTIGKIRIFPIPSSHAKGSLSMEACGTYVFIGDALCCRGGRNGFSYNAQLLKEEIDVLESLSAPYLLVSHRKGLVQNREEAIAELREIYGRREKGSNEIPL